MKVIAASLLALTSANDFIDSRKFSAISKMAFKMTTTSFSAKEFGKRIQNYGCHCFPGFTKEAGGAGEPVNAVDGLCKQLSKCHKCVALNFPGEVDVNTGKYNWENTGGAISCDETTNPARKALCECDAKFAMDMGNTWDDADFNEFYWLAAQNTGAVFDQAATCAVAAGAGGSGNADQCCNNVPYDSNAKSCCGATTLFNPVLADCCTDGTVVSPGAC